MLYFCISVATISPDTIYVLLDISVAIHHAGYSCVAIHHAGYSCVAIHHAGYSCVAIHHAGYSCVAIHHAGYSCVAIHHAGYSCMTLRNCFHRVWCLVFVNVLAAFLTNMTQSPGQSNNCSNYNYYVGF